jgi:hypothetical protein
MCIFSPYNLAGQLSPIEICDISSRDISSELFKWLTMVNLITSCTLWWLKWLHNKKLKHTLNRIHTQRWLIGPFPSIQKTCLQNSFHLAQLGGLEGESTPISVLFCQWSHSQITFLLNHNIFFPPAMPLAANHSDSLYPFWFKAFASVV